MELSIAFSSAALTAGNAENRTVTRGMVVVFSCTRDEGESGDIDWRLYDSNKMILNISDISELYVLSGDSTMIVDTTTLIEGHYCIQCVLVPNVDKGTSSVTSYLILICKCDHDIDC